MSLFVCYNGFMKYIIYDFNGTLLDDVDLCIDCLNAMIERYLDREAIERKEYLDIFTFPVIDYYKKAGFTFEKDSFEKVGREWMDLYESDFSRYILHEGVIEQLQDNLNKGYKNVILSASKLENLMKQCEYLGIVDYFDAILGIDNIYAGSKVEIAKKYMEDKRAEDCIFIGDTLHDFDVASAIGIECILVAKGHQSKDKLLSVTDRVYNDLREIEL